MLLMNVFRDSVIPMTFYGGTSLSCNFTNFNKSEDWLSIYISGAEFSKTTSMPDGNTTPVTWRLPLKAGAISCTRKIFGSGTVTKAQRHYGIAILASLSGQGGITEAITVLAIALIADLTGSGDITDADAKAYLDLLADLVGDGNITDADFVGIGELIADLLGDSTLASLLPAIGELSSDIRSYGSLTPEGIKDAVWNAVATSYNVTGTMGQKLNSAAVGGVDYGALAEAVWDAEVSGRTVLQAGKILENIKNNAGIIPALL